MNHNHFGTLKYDPVDPNQALDKLNSSKGIRAFVLVDQGISDFYRSLIPKCHNVQPQMYQAHVTVVRNYKEIPVNMESWGKYQNEQISFVYNGNIQHDGIYYWLSVKSQRIAEIRIELGLPAIRNPFEEYHLTIGNRKSQEEEEEEEDQQDFWVSCPKFTGLITVVKERIAKTPPVWRKFEGQSFASLVNWLKRFGNCDIQEM